MYERILVPIDAGATAAQGLKEVGGIALSHGSRIHLLHTVDELPAAEPCGGGGGGEFVMARLRDIGRAVLEASAEEVRKCGVGVESELLEQMRGAPRTSSSARPAPASPT